MARKWTTEEIEYLREHYALVGLAQVSAVLERTEAAIAAKAKRLGLKSRKATAEEDETIRAAVLAGASETEMVKITGRVPRFIRGRAQAMNLGDRLRQNRDGVYTEADVATITQMSSAGATAEQIAKELGRTPTAIRCYCRRSKIDLVDARVKSGDRLARLGGKKTRGAPAHAYTEAELAIMRTAAKDGLTAREIIEAEQLPGRTAVGVYLKARSLGLDIPRVRHSK